MSIPTATMEPARHGETRSNTDPVAALLKAHRPGYSLAQPFYTDRAVFEAELQAIWYKEWLLAGMSCEVAAPYQWRRFDVGPASVIIMRGDDGVLRAMHNTCRHRGSRICLEDKGTSRNLVCPYHQWTYASNGALLFAKEMGADFDKRDHGLRPVHVREVAGYIFVSLADQPASFDEFATTVTPYLAPHGLADAKVAHESTLIENANWKLVLENNRECYHCKVSHPELLQTIAEIEDLNDPRCTPAYRDKSLRDTQRWDAQGLTHTFQRSPAGWQIVRVPMYNGLSFTMDGQPASRRVMGSLPDFDVGSTRLLRFPNTWNHALGDHAIAFQVLPVDEHTTRLVTKWLVHRDAVEGVDYDLDRLVQVWDATNQQDRTLAQNNQAGIRSPGYQPGPYSPEMEGGVMAFIDWYLDKMRA